MFRRTPAPAGAGGALLEVLAVHRRRWQYLAMLEVGKGNTSRGENGRKPILHKGGILRRAALWLT